MGSKPIENTEVSGVNVHQVKKHWVRHAIAVIIITIVALAAWLAYTSLIHKAV